MVGYNRTYEPMVTYGQMNLIINTRNLWRDLVMWSRAYLVSRFSGIGMTEDVFKRLYKVAVDFGNVFRLVFGDRISEKAVQDLSSIIMIYRDLIEAEITGNSDKSNDKIKELYQSADERAAFMASINPYWDETKWKNLFYTFIYDSQNEITSFLTGDPKNIDVFDHLLQHADIMGDYFSQGLFDYMALGQKKMNQ